MNGLDQITLVLATTLAGIVAVPILQVLKRYLKLSDTPMAWAATVFAIIIGASAALLTGQVTLSDLLANPFLLFGAGGIVQLFAQPAYRTIKEKLGLGEAGEKAKTTKTKG